MLNLFCFSPYWPPDDVASSAIAYPFRRGGIPSTTRRNYHGIFRILSSGPPSNIISPSYHHLCFHLASFAAPRQPASPLHLHPPSPSQSSRNIFRPPSPSSSSSSSACMHLYIFCHHLHPCLTLLVFSTTPLSVLLSDPPARRHHISVTPESLPPLDLLHLSNMLSLHPYSPTPSQYYSSLFISIYLSISYH